MRRLAYIIPLACLSLSGCVSVDPGPPPGFTPDAFGTGIRQPHVPGVQGPYGQSVPMTAPYAYRPPASSMQAKWMMQNSMPMTGVQMTSPNMAAQMGMTAPGALPPQMVMPAGGLLSPPGVPPMPGAPGGMTPFPPGRGGMPPFPPSRGGMPPFPPGLGGIMPAAANMPRNDSGLMQASYTPQPPPRMDANINPAAYGMVNAMGAMQPSDGVRFSVQRTQVRFIRPTGMRISWFTRGPDGRPAYSTTPLETPGRYNFQQGAVYRLKLSNIERRPGLEIYPTLEVVPVNSKTEAFLAHSAVPVEFTDEDFNQIAQGNLVVKVIYLPDPQYQEYAGAGIDQILSTQLEPGADPIKEALRRGSILLVIRMGNVDQEAPNTPPLGASSTSSNNASATAGMAGMTGPYAPPMAPYFMPPVVMPPCCAPPAAAPVDAKDAKDAKQDDAGPAAPPGVMPNLPAAPSVAPPESVRAQPPAPSTPTPTVAPVPDIPGAATTPPPGSPEVGPPPTQLFDTSAPGGAPSTEIPEELLKTMPPEARQIPIRMPDVGGPPDEGLPTIENSRPPIMPLGAQNDGRPTMLPATDPGQPPPTDLQPISGTAPTRLP